VRRSFSVRSSPPGSCGEAGGGGGGGEGGKGREQDGGYEYARVCGGGGHSRVRRGFSVSSSPSDSCREGAGVKREKQYAEGSHIVRVS
jgi:hypothetical protein